MNTLPNLRLYALALHLYPTAFRARYADEMLDTARHEYARSPNHLRFTTNLAADTLRSLFREHLRAASSTRPGYVAAFAFFFSFLVLTVSVVHQQILRRNADALPRFIANLVSSPRLDAQSEPARQKIVADHLSAPSQEISTPTWLSSTAVFTVLYDASAHAITGNATLHGALPQPPIGIFNEIRARGNDEVTWRPQPGVRVALSGRPMPDGGFVVTGQSLIPGEARTARLNSILRWIWAFAMLTCCFLAFSARKQTRPPTA
jgi:hypothetical protein